MTPRRAAVALTGVVAIMLALPLGVCGGCAHLPKFQEVPVAPPLVERPGVAPEAPVETPAPQPIQAPALAGVVPPAEAPAEAGSTPPLVSPMAHADRLVPGERLFYTVHWFGIPVVRAETVVGESPVLYHDRPYLEIEAAARSTGLVRRIFNVEDRMFGLLDPVTFQPATYQTHLRHGLRRDAITEEIRFDHANRRAISNTWRVATLKITPGARGLLSTFYYLRTLDLTSDRPVVADVIAHGQLCQVIVSVNREGLLTMAHGTYAVQEVEIEASWLDRYIRHQRLRVWVTKDQTHTPVMFRLRVPVFGMLTALLDRRHPVMPPQIQPSGGSSTLDEGSPLSASR